MALRLRAVAPADLGRAAGLVAELAGLRVDGPPVASGCSVEDEPDELTCGGCRCEPS